MTVLLTGAAGFIGFHVARALLDRGERVVGVDNLNAYYDVGLKRARLARLEGAGFRFVEADVSDRAAMAALVEGEPDAEHVVHLAAQAGVRFSMQDPYAYVTSNVMGHVVVLEAARRLTRLRHLVYASSSSVYGLERTLPFDEGSRADTPSSLYAATKRADELISHAYTHLYGLPQTGLRFFTVYGPWGRPDMAYYSFARAISEGRPITLYEGGRLRRDFTYRGRHRGRGAGRARPAAGGGGGPPRAQHRQQPLGAGESAGGAAGAGAGTAGRGAAARPAGGGRGGDLGPGGRRGALAGYAPRTPLEVGVPRFVAWFREFHAEAQKGG